MYEEFLGFFLLRDLPRLSLTISTTRNIWWLRLWTNVFSRSVQSRWPRSLRSFISSLLTFWTPNIGTVEYKITIAYWNLSFFLRHSIVKFNLWMRLYKFIDSPRVLWDFSISEKKSLGIFLESYLDTAFKREDWVWRQDGISFGQWTIFQLCNFTWHEPCPINNSNLFYEIDTHTTHTDLSK